MKQVTIYHNPRCSKSRQTLELLKEKNSDIEVIEYLKTPPNAEKITELMNMLGEAATKIVRTKEAEFASSGIDLNSSESVAKGLASYPKLMERPVVVSGNKAVLGRPPENIEKLF